MGFNWTAENTEELRKLIEDDKCTYEEAARRLGTKRNACIGRYSRVFGEKKRKATSPVEKPKTPCRLLVWPGDPNFVGPVYLPEIHELGERQCKWPVAGGDAGPHRFCGALRPFGKPYCSRHTQMSTRLAPEPVDNKSETPTGFVRRTASGAWMS